MKTVIRKLLITVLALVVVISCIGVLTACHSHTYDESRWETDATYHWHPATCKHTEQVSDKAEHTFNAQDKCDTCGYEKEPTLEVDQETWTQALDFSDKNNWIYSLAVLEIEYIQIRREGNVAYTAMQGEEQYFEFNGDVIWQYAQVNSKWQKFDRSDNSDYLAIEMQLETAPDAFGEFQYRYDEFEFVNGAYELQDASLYVYNPLLGENVLDDATVKVCFNNGEIVSISIVEQVTVDGETYTVMALSMTFGTANVQLPDAELHQHEWVLDDVYESDHYMECFCGDYKLEVHDYDSDGVCSVCQHRKHQHSWYVYDVDIRIHYLRCEGCGTVVWLDHEYEDGVCSVCGVKNHEHVFDIYISIPNQVDYHTPYCECGVRDLNEKCEFNEHDICVKCRALRRYHEHTLAYSGERDETYHYMECSVCGALVSEVHNCTSEQPCTVCGYTLHEHEWEVASQASIDEHIVTCSVCGLTDIEAHDFETSDVCSKCGAVKHIHNWVWTGEYHVNIHYMSCEDCGGISWETHSFDDEDDHECNVCGAPPHTHNWEFIGSSKVTETRHQLYCDDCGASGWQNHYGEGDTCQVCGYVYGDKIEDDDKDYASAKFYLSPSSRNKNYFFF